MRAEYDDDIRGGGDDTASRGDVGDDGGNSNGECKEDYLREWFDNFCLVWPLKCRRGGIFWYWMVGTHELQEPFLGGHWCIHNSNQNFFTETVIYR